MSDQSTSRADIAFGSDNNFQGATVSVGDVVGRDKITYTAHDWYDVRGLRDRNPYLGLKSYSYDQQAKFAGRTALAETVVNHLTAPGQQRSVYFITGASGCGKTSLAQAGVLPRLQAHYAAQHITVRWLQTRPSRLPLTMLTDALRGLDATIPLGATLLAAELVALFRTMHHPNQLMVLILDEFEDVFIRSEPAEREALFGLLTTLPPFAELPLHIIITMRSGYLPDLFAYAPIFELAKNGTDVRGMSEDELQDAIQRPLTVLLEQLGRPPDEKRFEPTLLAKLVHDAAQDATYLPLLGMTLEDLWRRGSLTAGHYTTLTDPIRARAEDVYAFVDYDQAKAVPRAAADQKIILDIFMELVNPSQNADPRRTMRRRRALDDLIGDDPRQLELIAELVDARLLSRDIETNGTTQTEVVDLIHESLLHNWARLQTEVGNQRALLERRSRFAQSLQEWLAHQESDEFLLNGVRLAEAESLLDDSEAASEPAQLFILRSVATREQGLRDELLKAQQLAAARQNLLRRTNKFIGGLALLVLLALLLAAWALRAQNLAEAQQTIAEERLTVADSQRLAAAAQSVGGNAPEAATLLAIEGVLMNRNLVTEQALRDAVNRVQWTPRPLVGHTDSILALAISPDGRLLATAGNDGSTYIWDSDGASKTRLTGHEGAVNTVAFNPAGDQLVTASNDQTARLWRIDGTLIRTFRNPGAAVMNAIWRPDGQVILTVDQNNMLVLWNVNGEQIQTFDAVSLAIFYLQFAPSGETVLMLNDASRVVVWNTRTSAWLTLNESSDIDTLSAVFSPDGQHILTAEADGTANIWALDGSHELSLEGHTERVSQVVWGDTYLLTASWDGTARVWDADGQQRAILRGHSSAVSSAIFSSAADRILTVSDDGTTRLWGNDGQLDATLAGPDNTLVVQAWFAANDTRIVTLGNDGSAYVWTPVSQNFVLAGHHNDVISAAFSPSDDTMMTASQDNNAYLWDANGAIIRRFAGHTDQINSAVWSADGAFILTASGDNTARLWPVGGGAPVTLVGHEGPLGGAVWSPVPSQFPILTASDDRTARLWALDGTPGPILIGHTDTVLSASFSPDGQLIVTTSADDTARVWSVAGALITTLEQHQDDVNKAVWSPDGALLLTISDDGTANLWDRKWQLLAVLDAHTEAVTNAAFSPSGDAIITTSADDTARIWNTDGELLQTLNGHSGDVMQATFSRNGSTILTASRDGTARLWSRDGRLLTILSGHRDWVQSAVWSADQQQVLTASADNTARLHFVQLADVLALAECRVERPLSAPERARYELDAPRFVFEQRRCPPQFSWQK